MKTVFTAICLASFSAKAAIQCLLIPVESSAHTKSYLEVRNENLLQIDFDVKSDGNLKVLRYGFSSDQGLVLIPTDKKEVITLFLENRAGFFSYLINTNMAQTAGSIPYSDTKPMATGAMYKLPDGRLATVVLSCFPK
ncbi:MAG: hypothetical protein ACAH59_11220 [Pseudobdellovibrionaceae bacterium]